MSLYYILEGTEIKPTDDLLGWARWFENSDNRRIAATEVGGAMVSTVFLGIDHGFAQGGEPILFETMIFGLNDDDEYQWRYADLEEAIMIGHEKAVGFAKSKTGVK